MFLSPNTGSQSPIIATYKQGKLGKYTIWLINVALEKHYFIAFTKSSCLSSAIFYKIDDKHDSLLDYHLFPMVFYSKL